MSAISLYRQVFKGKPSTIRHQTKKNRPKLALQQLELRSLLSATFDPADQILRVEGTDQSDHIRIINEAGEISVEGSDITLADGSVVASLPVSEMLYARVDGLEGDDRIEMVQRGVSPGMGLVLEADGGAGNDTLVGGSADDRLYGGADVDQLVGGAGDDLLDGGGDPGDALFAAGSMDATGLLPVYFSVDYEGHDSTTSFDVDLSPGEHFVFTHGDAYASFVVGDDGTMSYDPALEGILNGAGTSSLEVKGVEVTIDASALLPAYMSVDYVPLEPGVPLTTRLLPGDHFVFAHGNAIVWFNVGNDGTISYDPELEGVLNGAGTNALSLNGVEVTIDTSTLLPAYMSVDYVPLEPGVPLTTRLLPGEHFVFTHGDAIVWFNVGNDGTISYDPELEGILGGAGTNALSLNGVEVTIDTSTLLASYMSVDYVPLEPGTALTTRFLPGDHFVFTYGEAYVWFNVANDGTISYDPELEGSLSGLGTSRLTLEGRSISIDPAALAGTAATIDYVAIDSQAEFLVNLLPGQHFITTLSGDALFFTVGTHGITHADPALKFGAPDQVVEFNGGSKITVNLVNGILNIEGTAGADRITIRQNGAFMTVFEIQPDGSMKIIGRTYHESEIASIVVNGYSGADTIRNETQKNSVMRGGSENDTLYGGHGQDEMFGEQGNDLLYGAPGGEDGVETSANGSDTLWGGVGNDTLWGGYFDDRLVGGDGSDVLHGQWGNDMIVGSNWNSITNKPDPVEIGSYNDTLFGENGNDTMYGGYGDDEMSGGWDSDLMYGEYGNDRMYGAFKTSTSERPGAMNNDTIYGGNGNDTIYGGDGNDALYGGTGIDYLYGQNGNDGLFGGWGDGKDVLNGGAGADRFLQTRFNLGLFRADEDTISDLEYQDAQVNFSNWDKNWTDDEIIKVDVGLAWLHQITNNTKLLELPDGSTQNTFYRIQTLGTALADNDGAGAGTIRVADTAFTRTDYPIENTVVHEVAHNWDQGLDTFFFFQLSGWEKWNLTDNPRIKNGFTQADLFGVMQTFVEGGKTYCWIYRNGTQFSRTDGYGRSGPREDFATCLETYYALTKPGSTANPAANWLAKWNFINDFLRNKRS